LLARRTSTNPAVRLERADKWLVYRALVAEELWEDGIGHLILARKESGVSLVFSAFLVDVYCLGVKNAFWPVGSPQEFEEVVEEVEEVQPLRPIAPECLVKIICGAVEYAQLLGFSPHPDFRHAGRLLVGIDPRGCSQEYRYGHDGRPFYVRGPNESLETAQAIAALVRSVGGDYLVPVEGSFQGQLEGHEDASDEDQSIEPEHPEDR
jgi:hypothetical protein